MRLFASVVPPADELDRLERAVQGRDLTGLRLVPRHQWHVTLAFYGEVPERVVPELTERLGRAAGRAPVMSLRLSGAGTFPRRPARARQLWVGVAGDVAALARLADSAAAAGRRCGLAMEDRPYRPHLTIGRSRGGPGDLRELVDQLSSYTGEPWSVPALVLVHSTLGAQVVHRTLAEWPIGRAAD